MLSFSVIIPTYNRKAVLGNALLSVIKQTVPAVEIIVIDDGSLDGTTEWVLDNFPSVEVISLNVNIGASAARNIGIRKSKGSLIAFLDSDDIWYPNYLRDQAAYLASNTNEACVFCNYVKIDNNFHIRIKAKWPGDDTHLHFILNDNQIHSMSLFVIRRQELLDLYPLREDLYICHDREMYIRLERRYIIGHNPLFLVQRNYSKDQVTANTSLWLREAKSLLKDFFGCGYGNKDASIKYLAYQNLYYRFMVRFKTKKSYFNMLLCLSKHLFYKALITLDRNTNKSEP